MVQNAGQQSQLVKIHRHIAILISKINFINEANIFKAVFIFLRIINLGQEFMIFPFLAYIFVKHSVGQTDMLI